jgi:hypothetical protein
MDISSTGQFGGAVHWLLVCKSKQTRGAAIRWRAAERLNFDAARV